MFARTDKLFARPCWRDDLATLMTCPVRCVLGRPAWPPDPDDRPDNLCGPRSKYPSSLLIFERNPDQPRLIGGADIAQGDAMLVLNCWSIEQDVDLSEMTNILQQVIAAIGDRAIASGCFIGSDRSKQVLRKLGFHPAGRAAMLKDHGRADRRCPFQYYSLDRPERSRRPAGVRASPDISARPRIRDIPAPALL
jgi:hypothetical protein